MIEMRCPSCNKRLNCPDDRAGHQVRCPGCRQMLVVPNQYAAASPQEEEGAFDLNDLSPPQTQLPAFDLGAVESSISVNVSQRFQNCRRYVAILAIITKIKTAICALLPLPFLASSFAAYSRANGESSSFYALAVTGVGSLAWWVFLAWTYICIMCGLELIQAVVEIEHNTRSTSTWLDRLCNRR